MALSALTEKTGRVTLLPMVWFTHGDAGDGSGGISIYHKNTWQHITLRDGLPVPYVRFIYQAQDSTVWLGTHRHDNVSGLLRYRNRNWLRLYKQDDLPVDNIYGITQARDGTIYLLPGGDKITRLQPDKLPLKTISGTLKDTSGKPVSNRGVHIRIAHDQIRAGCRTDSMGNYHLEIFKEIHAVQTTEIFERVQTRSQNLIGNWQGLLHKRRIIFKLTSLNDTTLTGVLDMPDLNHMLQKAEKGLPEEYTRIEHTISDTALVTLTKWLAQHTHRE